MIQNRTRGSFGFGTQQVVDERRAEIDRGVRAEHIAERALDHRDLGAGDVRKPRQALGIAIETAIRRGRRHMLRRIDRGGERDVGVADDASAALRAPDVARRKALAVLQRGDFVFDRLVRKRARQKHELHRGRRPIGGDGLRRRGERLSEQLAAVDASVLVDLAHTATEAPRLRRSEAQQVGDVGAVPSRRAFIHEELLAPVRWQPLSLTLTTPRPPSSRRRRRVIEP